MRSAITEREVQGYKEMAAHVLNKAIADLNIKSERGNALDFLTGDHKKGIRSHWLAWLGLDDAAFQRLIHAKEFQGSRNKTWFAKAPA